MQMNENVLDMAHRSFGYGRWSAPYWFLGPEQGMSKKGGDSLEARAEAWSYFGRRALDDCREFHLRIEELGHHGEGATPQLTWKRLIIAMLAYRQKGTDLASVLRYQKEELGCLSGETCVIELSGLAAHSLREKRDRATFLSERIGEIRRNMLQIGPDFVILYGKHRSCQKAWQALATDSVAITQPSGTPMLFRRCGRTVVAWTEHPANWGQTDEGWKDLGVQMRKLRGEAATSQSLACH